MLDIVPIEAELDWFRAGGNCLCPICGKEYYDHPHYRLTVGGWKELCDGRIIEGNFWLRAICNGWIVKL